MPRYRVEGNDLQSGTPRPFLSIDARDEAEARRLAAKRGMAVTLVQQTIREPFPGPVAFIWLWVPALLALALIAAGVVGGLPGTGIAALLAATKLIDAPVGTAAGVGAAIGTGIAILVEICIVVCRDRNANP